MQDNYQEDKEESMMKMVKEAAKIILSGVRAAGSEASFSEKYIMPAIRKIILENTPDNIVYSL